MRMFGFVFLSIGLALGLMTGNLSAKPIKPTNSIEKLIAPLSLLPVGGARNPTIQVIRQGPITNTRIAGAGSWAELNDILFTLLEIPHTADREVIDALLKHKNDVPGVLLYDLSRRIWKSGNVEEGLYWHWYALYRTRYDLKRCLDGRVETPVGLLQRAIDPYFGDARQKVTASQHVAAIQRVLNESDLFGSEASPWWACSTSPAVMIFAGRQQAEGTKKPFPQEAWLAPASTWPSIQARLRKEATEIMDGWRARK